MNKQDMYQKFVMENKKFIQSKSMQNLMSMQKELSSAKIQNGSRHRVIDCLNEGFPPTEKEKGNLDKPLTNYDIKAEDARSLSAKKAIQDRENTFVKRINGMQQQMKDALMNDEMEEAKLICDKANVERLAFAKSIAETVNNFATAHDKSNEIVFSQKAIGHLETKLQQNITAYEKTVAEQMKPEMSVYNQEQDHELETEKAEIDQISYPSKIEREGGNNVQAASTLTNPTYSPHLTNQRHAQVQAEYIDAVNDRNTPPLEKKMILLIQEHNKCNHEISSGISNFNRETHRFYNSSGTMKGEMDTLQNLEEIRESLSSNMEKANLIAEEINNTIETYPDYFDSLKYPKVHQMNSSELPAMPSSMDIKFDASKGFENTVDRREFMNEMWKVSLDKAREFNGTTDDPKPTLQQRERDLIKASEIFLNRTIVNQNENADPNNKFISKDLAVQSVKRNLPDIVAHHNANKIENFANNVEQKREQELQSDSLDHDQEQNHEIEKEKEYEIAM